MTPSRTTTRLSLHWLFSVVLGATLGGCSSHPSYHADQVPAAIEQLCAKDYHVKVSARRTGQTLTVHIHDDRILDLHEGQITLGASAEEVLSNVMQVIHRVVLSSDALSGFYVILASDPMEPSVYLTVVRNIDDVLRVNASVIPFSEFLSRMVLELKYLQIPSGSFELNDLQDITLSQFLSWQLARRIQARLAERVQREAAPMVEVGPCGGKFDNGEFAFTLNVTSPTGLSFDDELLQQIFLEATTEIAQVLSGYAFSDFNAIRLIHPATGRNLLLPKAQLEIFR